MNAESALGPSVVKYERETKDWTSSRFQNARISSSGILEVFLFILRKELI
jgi:hypothetical protein